MCAQLLTCYLYLNVNGHLNLIYPKRALNSTSLNAFFPHFFISVNGTITYLVAQAKIIKAIYDSFLFLILHILSSCKSCCSISKSVLHLTDCPCHSLHPVASELTLLLPPLQYIFYTATRAIFQNINQVISMPPLGSLCRASSWPSVSSMPWLPPMSLISHPTTPFSVTALQLYCSFFSFNAPK